MKHLIAAALLALALPASAETKARAFLALTTAVANPMPAMPAGETRTFPSALDIVFVAPGSPGEAAGIREGDTVLALDGQGFDPKDGDPAVAWRRRIEAMMPGTGVTLTVLRRSVVTRATKDGADVADPDAFIGGLGATIAAMPPGGAVSVEARRTERVEDVTLTLARHPLDPPEGGAPAMPRSAPSPYELLARDLAERAKTGEALDALEAGLASIGASADEVRLPQVRQVQAQPWSLPETSLRAAAALAPQDGRVLPCVSAVLRGTECDGVAAVVPSGATLDDIVRELTALLATEAGLRDAALAKLSPEERAHVVAQAPGLAAALSETIYLHADEDTARAKANRRLLDIARKAAYPVDASVAALDETVLAPGWLGVLAEVLRAQPNASDEYILRRQTPQGEIVIGGTGRNIYRDMEPAVIVDLGGDDLYANGAGTAMGDARPVSIAIDLAGNDTYEGTDAFVQGCGVLGVGLLVDVAGDDRYLGKDGAQAAAVMGVGILVDRAGSDRYRALHFAQGTGFFGLGVVIDEAGNDAYEALSQAQGLGLPGGVGVLHDVAGDDRYFAKGGAKTGYGTQGVFDGWSQGCGLGLRYLASGGFGLLADDAGADEYEAGNFSQGGGYFFGFGMLRDGGRSGDRYVGSRYGQGWTAHQAVGAFLDEGGDDTYDTTHGVIAGLAWDQSVTWFCDRSGNDAYRGSFFSLGASAHNGVTIFEDDDGSDSYAGVEIARSGPNDYHGGTSFTLFLDLGRGRDAYDKGAPGHLQQNGEHGFALDLPGDLRRWAVPGAVGGQLDKDAAQSRRKGGT